MLHLQIQITGCYHTEANPVRTLHLDPSLPWCSHTPAPGKVCACAFVCVYVLTVIGLEIDLWKVSVKGENVQRAADQQVSQCLCVSECVSFFAWFLHWCFPFFLNNNREKRKHTRKCRYCYWRGAIGAVTATADLSHIFNLRVNTIYWQCPIFSSVCLLLTCKNVISTVNHYVHQTERYRSLTFQFDRLSAPRTVNVLSQGFIHRQDWSMCETVTLYIRVFKLLRFEWCWQKYNPMI